MAGPSGTEIRLPAIGFERLCSSRDERTETHVVTLTTEPPAIATSARPDLHTLLDVQFMTYLRDKFLDRLLGSSSAGDDAPKRGGYLFEQLDAVDRRFALFLAASCPRRPCRTRTRNVVSPPCATSTCTSSASTCAKPAKPTADLRAVAAAIGY